MMTADERAAKEQIMDTLYQEGYKRYAQLLSNFDINLTNDPNVVAYTIPSKATITINPSLSSKQVSLIIRHELLHNFLKHMLRMEAHVGSDVWNKRDPTMHELSNIAADYEISNRGYTPLDKKNAKRIRLNGKAVEGLVTDVDHPEWVNLSMEEMFDELNKENSAEKQQIQQRLQQEAQMQQEMQQAAQAAMDQLSDGSGGQSSSQQGEGDQDQGEQSSGNQSQSKQGAGNQKGQVTKILRIGDMGDAAVQQAEAIARAAQVMKERAEKANTPAGDDAADDAERAAKAADALAKAGKDFDKKTKDQVILDQEMQHDADELLKRGVQLSKLFQDATQANALIAEVQNIVSQEERAKAEAEIERFRQSGSHKFMTDFRHFMNSVLGYTRGETWTKFNKKYDGSGLLKPGYTNYSPKEIPLLNVYYDRSGSITAEDVAKLDAVLSTIENYRRQGKIRVAVWYFGSRVSDNPNNCGGGTDVGDDLVQHIKDTKATNVVILSDSDMETQGTWQKAVKVPGAVFLVWTNELGAPRVADYIRGKMFNGQYKINS